MHLLKGQENDTHSSIVLGVMIYLPIITQVDAIRNPPRNKNHEKLDDKKPKSDKPASDKPLKQDKENAKSEKSLTSEEVGVLLKSVSALYAAKQSLEKRTQTVVGPHKYSDHPPGVPQLRNATVVPDVERP